MSQPNEHNAQPAYRHERRKDFYMAAQVELARIYSGVYGTRGTGRNVALHELDRRTVQQILEREKLRGAGRA